MLTYNFNYRISIELIFLQLLQERIRVYRRRVMNDDMSSLQKVNRLRDQRTECIQWYQILRGRLDAEKGRQEDNILGLTVSSTETIKVFAFRS